MLYDQRKVKAVAADLHKVSALLGERDALLLALKQERVEILNAFLLFLIEKDYNFKNLNGHSVQYVVRKFLERWRG